MVDGWFYTNILIIYFNRKNLDQISLECVMDILKCYIREEDGHFSTLNEVINFKFAFWEERLFQKVRVLKS